jgi:hypothetical protein
MPSKGKNAGEVGLFSYSELWRAYLCKGEEGIYIRGRASGRFARLFPGLALPSTAIINAAPGDSGTEDRPYPLKNVSMSRRTITSTTTYVCTG